MTLEKAGFIEGEDRSQSVGVESETTMEDVEKTHSRVGLKKKKKRKVLVTEGREKFFVFLLKRGDKQCC